MKKTTYQITVGRSPLKGPQYNNLSWKEAEKQAQIVKFKPELHRYKEINIERHGQKKEN